MCENSTYRRIFCDIVEDIHVPSDCTIVLFKSMLTFFSAKAILIFCIMLTEFPQFLFFSLMMIRSALRMENVNVFQVVN